MDRCVGGRGQMDARADARAEGVDGCVRVWMNGQMGEWADGRRPLPSRWNLKTQPWVLCQPMLSVSFWRQQPAQFCPSVRLKG